MKATIKRLAMQHDALVEVIQFLDSHGHSDTEVRETVDRILNSRSFDELEEDSNREIELAQIRERNEGKRIDRVLNKFDGLLGDQS